MITRWYGNVIAGILGLSLFIPGLRNRQLIYFALFLLLADIALATSHHILQQRQFTRARNEIAERIEIDLSRVLPQLHTLRVIEKIISLCDYTIYLLCASILILNWRYLFTTT
jgi:hypothetical protein